MKIYKYTPHLISLAFLSSLIYVFYRFYIHHEGQYFYYYQKYFVITFVLFISSIPLYFIKDSLRKIIFNTTILLILAFYSVETILVVQLKSKIDNEKINFEDKRSIIQVIDDYKNEGVPVLPAKYAHYSNEYDLFSFGGVSNMFTVFCNENGYWATYISDRYGFRNPDSAWDSDNVTVLVGDSTTQGACVNDEDTLAGNMRRMINEDNFKETIISLGVGARGPVTEYANLREYIELLKPKKIVWLYHESNDLYELETEVNSENLKKYTKDESFRQNLHLKQEQIDKILKNQIKKSIDEKKNNPNTNYLDGWYNLIYFLRLSLLRLKILHPYQHSYDESTIIEFEKIMMKVKKLSLKYNSELYFVYLPDYWRYVNNNTIQFNNYGEIKNVIKRLEIDLIDINELFFAKEKDQLQYWPFRKFGHYNELGFNKVSQKIYDKINWLQK